MNPEIISYRGKALIEFIDRLGLSRRDISHDNATIAVDLLRLGRAHVEESHYMKK